MRVLGALFNLGYSRLRVIERRKIECHDRNSLQTGFLKTVPQFIDRNALEAICNVVLINLQTLKPNLTTPPDNVLKRFVTAGRDSVKTCFHIVRAGVRR
jgi:hypothetical protein